MLVADFEDAFHTLGVKVAASSGETERSEEGVLSPGGGAASGTAKG